MLMKPEGSAKCHQILSSSGWGLSMRLGSAVNSFTDQSKFEDAEGS